jgi:hypothetical protein
MNVKIKQVALSDITINPDNPRTITGKNMDRLVKSLKDFPEMLELREIVVDENMVVIGGNMRLLALRKSGAKTATAKIVNGLTPEQKREFVIKDNAGFGEWNMDALANSWSDFPLADWGVDGIPIDELIDGAEEGEEVEIKQSVQLKPPMEYILILCEPNSIEWEELKEKLKLKMVRQGGFKKGSPFDHSGIERVLSYYDFKERIADAYCNTK